MPGDGRGGLGRGGARRHRKILHDTIKGITKPAIRRLARRGGVKRINGLVYEETRGVLRAFLENVIRDAVTYTEHAKRSTVTALDVVYALKRQGRTLYGYDTVRRSEPSRPPPRHKKKKKSKAAPAIDFSRDPGLCVGYFAVGDREKRILELRSGVGAYLNDNIINALMCHYTADTGFFPMTSFWYDKFVKGTPTNRYFKPTDKLSRFIPPGIKNIGEMNGIVIPINEHGNHWTVVIVDFRAKKITYYNSLMDNDPYFDDAVDNVFMYLESEREGMETPKKTPFHFDRSEWRKEFEDTPEQPDGVNCGVYVAMRVRKYLKDIDFPPDPDAGRDLIIHDLGL